MLENKVLFISGSMFGGKSKMLLDLINIVHKDNMSKYLVFKPTKDSRDGLYVKSRVYNQTVQTLAWDQNYSEMKTIFDYTIAGFSITNPDDDKFIFFDEVHFLSLDEIKYITKICKKYNCKLIVAGLETNFMLEYFETSKWLKDKYGSVFFHGICNRCGEENAVHNVLYEDGQIVSNGNAIRPGNNEYKVYCDECLDTILKEEIMNEANIW